MRLETAMNATLPAEAKSRAEYLLFLAKSIGLEREGVTIGIAKYKAWNPFKSVFGPTDGNPAIHINYDLSPNSSALRQGRRLPKNFNANSRYYRIERTPWGRTIRLLTNHGKYSPCVVEIVTKSGLIFRLDTELSKAELYAHKYDPHILWAIVFSDFPEVYEFLIFAAPPRDNGKDLLRSLAGVWGVEPYWEGVWEDD